MSGTPVFIPLTQAQSKKIILINMGEIESVSTYRSNSRLFTMEKDERGEHTTFYEVKETPTQILAIFMTHAHPGLILGELNEIKG